jgi:hypothetical protein
LLLNFNIKGSKPTKIGTAVKNGNVTTIIPKFCFETVQELVMAVLIKGKANRENTVVGAAKISPQNFTSCKPTLVP